MFGRISASPGRLMSWLAVLSLSHSVTGISLYARGQNSESEKRVYSRMLACRDTFHFSFRGAYSVIRSPSVRRSQGPGSPAPSQRGIVYSTAAGLPATPASDQTVQPKSFLKFADTFHCAGCVNSRYAVSIQASYPLVWFNVNPLLVFLTSTFYTLPKANNITNGAPLGSLGRVSTGTLQG